MQQWRRQRKGIWSGILKRYTGATRGISLKKTNKNKTKQKTPLHGSNVRDLKAQLAARQSIFTKPKAAAIACYRVSHVLAKHKKAFKDGDIVKEAFVEAADSLFDDFKN